MLSFDKQCEDYQTVARALWFMVQSAQEQPDLATLAKYLKMSESHCQKLFSRWVGVSPKRFLQYLTKEHVRQILTEGKVEDAADASGLSTKSRVYDLIVNCEAMTAGEYQRRGRDLTIRYGWHPSPFGHCFIAITDRGICKLAFVEESNQEAIFTEFTEEWGQADCRNDQAATAPLMQQIFALERSHGPLRLLIKGTNFQLKVWEALLDVRFAQLTTYASLAEHIEQPLSIRAVGTAVGKNPIAFLVPCHRVIRKSGEIHRYRWGTERKHALIAWEQAMAETRALPPHGNPD